MARMPWTGMKRQSVISILISIIILFQISTSKANNQLLINTTGCKLDFIAPFDERYPEIAKYYKKEDPTECITDKPPLSFMKDGTLHVSHEQYCLLFFPWLESSSIIRGIKLDVSVILFAIPKYSISVCPVTPFISLRHSVNGDFCGHSRFVLWHQNLTTFVCWTLAKSESWGGGEGLALIS